MYDLWDVNCKILYRIFNKYCRVQITSSKPYKAQRDIEKAYDTAYEEMRCLDSLYLGDGYTAHLETFLVPDLEEETYQLGFRLFFNEIPMGRIYDVRANNMYIIISLPRTNIVLHRGCNGRDFPDSDKPPTDIEMVTGFVTAPPEEDRVQSLYDLVPYEDRKEIRTALLYGSQALPEEPKPKRTYRRRSSERGNT